MVEAGQLNGKLEALKNLKSSADSIGGVEFDIEDEKRKQVAKKFEAIFVRQILDKMKDTIPESDMEDASSKQIKGMYWSFLGDAIAQKGGFGLWENIYRDMCENQGVTPKLGREINAAAGARQNKPKLDEVL